MLLAAFATLAGGLAIIGLYSVLAYLVTERTREIGIRLAIGAGASRVTRMVLGQGLRLTISRHSSPSLCCCVLWRGLLRGCRRGGPAASIRR